MQTHLAKRLPTHMLVTAPRFKIITVDTVVLHINIQTLLQPHL